MNAFKDPSKFLGIDDNTPSTPVVSSKRNPFDPKVHPSLLPTSSASSTSSTASTVTTKGGHHSRHQEAEPPRPTPGIKKEKGVKHPKHAKMASTSKNTNGGTDGSSKKTSSVHKNGGSKDSSRPTNVLVVPKHQKRSGVVRPAKPVPPSPTASVSSSGGSGTSSGPSKQQKLSSFDDLFKVDVLGGSDRSNGGNIGTKSSSKSRKTHSTVQQHQTPPTTFSEPHPPNHSSSSAHKPGGRISSLPPSTHGGVPSTHATPPSSSSCKLKKSSSATQLSVSASSLAGRDPPTNVDTKSLLRIQKTSSMDYPVSPQRQLLPQEGDERAHSIDIAQISAMTLEPSVPENGNVSAISLPSGLMEEKSGRKERRKKPKKTKRKEKVGEIDKEREMKVPEDVKLPLIEAREPPTTAASAPPVSTLVAMGSTSAQRLLPVHSHVTTVASHVTSVAGHVAARVQDPVTTAINRIHQVPHPSKRRPSNLHFDSRYQGVIIKRSFK